MAYFIKSSCEQTSYKNTDINNAPINIELVTQVIKIQEHWYPDNDGTSAIYFKGIDVKWIYGKHETEQRNLDYECIVNNNFKDLVV